jgi:putative ABC transport system permease protein
MADSRANNRTMFWRIIRRLLVANRGRLFVILLALGAGATVTAALLNLQVDAARRLTSEFRSFGANVVVAPRNATTGSGSATFGENLLWQIPATTDGHPVLSVASLYLVAEISAANAKAPAKVVVAGKSTLTDRNAPTAFCLVGAKVAERMNVHARDSLSLRTEKDEHSCVAVLLQAAGSADDNQVAVPLGVAQRLAALPGRISLIQIGVPGTPRAIEAYVADLAHRLSEADVRPIRQFTEAEGKIYNSISGLLQATVALVLILTVLCVMAAMTNVAMERKNDVGLMKAIGGATRRVLRLFLAEAALLGLIGGTIGAAAGIALSIWLGQAVFGLAARPRLIVYPVAVALTVIVAIAGAYPLRRLATLRPASLFRGET